MSALKKISNNNNGASSVLVLFMMMVLLTLGALAITSANVNYKLSQRTLEWNEMYYSIDEKGEEFLLALDQKLAEAEEKAHDYVKSKKYQQTEQPEIPQKVQTDILALYKRSNSNSNEILNSIYMHYANILINELTSDFATLQVYQKSNQNLINYIRAEIKLQSEMPSHEFCGLGISISVKPLKYEISEINGSTSLVKTDSGSRYKIEDWYEYQDALDKESKNELWDGTL